MTTILSLRTLISLLFLVPGLILFAIGLWPLGVAFLVIHHLYNSAMSDFMRVRYPQEYFFVPVVSATTDAPAVGLPNERPRGRPELHLVK